MKFYGADHLLEIAVSVRAEQVLIRVSEDDAAVSFSGSGRPRMKQVLDRKEGVELLTGLLDGLGTPVRREGGEFSEGVCVGSEGGWLPISLKRLRFSYTRVKGNEGCVLNLAYSVSEDVEWAAVAQRYS